MIVVDTSVWIAMLNQEETRQAGRCIELIEEGAPVGLTDVLFAEIPQELRTDREVALVEAHLLRFPIVRLESLDDFASSPNLYRGPGAPASRFARPLTV